MESSERGLERAEEFQLKQSELAVQRIRGSLVAQGDQFCGDCGDEIEEARRIALPSATRCVECQGGHERQNRLRCKG